MLGARPQFVKAAPLSRALRRRPAHREIIVHTGQHYDSNMSKLFFDELDIPSPERNLHVGSAPHGEQTGRMLAALEREMLAEAPELVLVYGDTNSTLAGALAAAKLNIPVGHVEAGLRSFNQSMPEEINRILTDHCSDLLFAPTRTAVRNLEREGLGGRGIHLVGDLMYDVARELGPIADRYSDRLGDLGLEGRRYVLATIHRAENTDDTERLRTILRALSEVARELPVVLPLHPRTRARISEAPSFHADLRLIDAVGYLDMAALERRAALVVTDSGGVQKEAYFHGVPCVTLRDETEWAELLEMGWNRLAPPRAGSEAIRDTIDAALAAGPPATATEAAPFGSGRAAEAIADILDAPALAAAGDPKRPGTPAAPPVAR